MGVGATVNIIHVRPALFAVSARRGSDLPFPRRNIHFGSDSASCCALGASPSVSRTPETSMMRTQSSRKTCVSAGPSPGSVQPFLRAVTHFFTHILALFLTPWFSRACTTCTLCVRARYNWHNPGRDWCLRKDRSKAACGSEIFCAIGRASRSVDCDANVQRVQSAVAFRSDAAMKKKIAAVVIEYRKWPHAGE